MSGERDDHSIASHSPIQCPANRSLKKSRTDIQNEMGQHPVEKSANFHSKVPDTFSQLQLFPKTVALLMIS